MTQVERYIRRKIRFLEHACSSGNVSKTCRYFGISRETFYCWRRQYRKDGEKGLINRRPGPRNPSWRTAPEIEKKVLHLRRTYHFGAQRISWYLQRYHRVEISEGGVRGTLSRHGLQRLPSTVNKRTIMARQVVKRYEKQVRDGQGRVAQPFGFALTVPYVRLSRIRLLSKVTRCNKVTASSGE